jgi:hypothetical protein
VYARRVNAGGGWIHPVVVVDGRVIATWRLGRRRQGFDIAVRPFESLEAGLLPLVEAEGRDVGRFLGAPATLRVGIGG